jgi:hypothetical protein
VSVGAECVIRNEARCYGQPSRNHTYVPNRYERQGPEQPMGEPCNSSNGRDWFGVSGMIGVGGGHADDDARPSRRSRDTTPE